MAQGRVSQINNSRIIQQWFLPYGGLTRAKLEKQIGRSLSATAEIKFSPMSAFGSLCLQYITVNINTKFSLYRVKVWKLWISFVHFHSKIKATRNFSTPEWENYPAMTPGEMTGKSWQQILDPLAMQNCSHFLRGSLGREIRVPLRVT